MPSYPQSKRMVWGKERKLRLILITSTILFAIVITLIFVPGSSDSGVASFPFLLTPGNIVTDSMLVISSLLLSIGLVCSYKMGFVLSLLIGFLTLFTFAMLFYLTLLYSRPVLLPNGTLLYVQPYPQTVVLLAFGALMLLFSPVSYLVKRKSTGRSVTKP